MLCGGCTQEGKQVNVVDKEAAGGGGGGGGGAHRHSTHRRQQDVPTPLKGREAPFGFRGYASRAPWSGGWGLWSRGIICLLEGFCLPACLPACVSSAPPSPGPSCYMLEEH